MTSGTPRTIRRRAALPALTVAGAALVLAACGSSSKTSSTARTSASGATTPPAAAGGGGASTGSATVSTASVAGVGTVLVNSSGKTLYLLTSEKGGKVTCTAANGCTKFWPPTDLPAGAAKATAGTGVQASMLGTAMAPDGSHYVTYAGYPLYTFSGDSAAGVAHGQGIASFGGTWWAISPRGVPVTTMAHSSSSSSPPTSSSSGGGYGGGGY